MSCTSFKSYSRPYISYVKSETRNDMKNQHYHDGYELYLQLDGERYWFCRNTTFLLHRGDIVLMNPFELHCSQSGNIDYYERYVLNFSLHDLDCILTEDEMNRLIPMIPSGYSHLEADKLETLSFVLSQLHLCRTRAHAFDRKLIASLLFWILNLLCEISMPDYEKASKIQPEIRSAIEYVNRNYADNISLDTLASEVHLSKYHLCRLFHETTGATFGEYLTNKRLTHVHRLLLETRLPIGEIAVQTGFSSGEHLTRVFRQAYGVPPREFRKTGAADFADYPNRLK